MTPDVTGSISNLMVSFLSICGASAHACMLGVVVFVLPAFQQAMGCSGVAISDYSLEAVLPGD